MLFVLSHNNFRNLGIKTFHYGDKVAHAVAYAGLSMMLYWAFRSMRHGWLFRWAALLAVIGASLYGISDEWHQSWGPGHRDADIWDWAADTVGAATMMLGVFLYTRFRKAPWQKQDEDWSHDENIHSGH
ncbi:MAG: VanZ family protein [Planctomycetes bacterium]|nr:VanZ family protein [Planctomycetota bacterium]